MKITFQTLKPNIFKLKPAKAELNRGAVNPINFLGVTCSEKNFQLKEINNLHCPVCGLVMLNPTQRKIFIDDVSTKTGQDLIDALEKYDDETALVGDDPKNEHKTIYRPVKAQVIEIIKETARKNPKLNLLQLVQLKGKEFYAPLIKEQLEITSELEKYLIGANITEEEKENIDSIISEFKKQIIGESETEFKRKAYMYALSSVAEDSEVQTKINEILEKLPTSTSDVNSFFVKYSKEATSSREIASKFVDMSIPTAEHLKPKSKGGKNSTANYICDCADCNTSRLDTDFDVWIKEKPQIAKGLQEYVYTIQKIIDEGNFHKSYNNYVEDIIKTINKLSYGKLKLRAPRSTNEEINQSIYAKRQEEIDNIKKKMDELKSRKSQLKALIKELESNPQFHNIVQLEIVKKQIDSNEKRMVSLNADLSAQRKIKQEALDNLTELTKLQISINEKDSEDKRKRHVELDEITSKKRLSEAEEKIEVYETAINNCSNNIAKLTRKANTLKKLVISKDELDEEINSQNRILNNYNALTSKIDSLKEIVLEEDEVKEKLAQLSASILELKSTNEELEKRILQETNGNFDIARDQWDEYQNMLELCRTGDDILDYTKSQDSKMPILTTKFVYVAKDMLKDRLIAFSTKNSVKYFGNLEKIKSLEEDEAKLKESLDNIKRSKTKIKEIEKSRSSVLGDTTYEELTKSLNYLKHQRETITNIEKISELRVELEIIEDTINYNENILKQLRNFKKMSSEQFQDYINMIFY